MPESGTYGSVRGVPGNRHPYRDRQQARQKRNVETAIVFLPAALAFGKAGWRRVVKILVLSVRKLPPWLRC